MSGSRGRPRLALLKPLSAAISIGTGGPFGAEGPIIMTGGAFGSMIGQLFHLTSVERRTPLVAGACAGMSAIFAVPLTAVLRGVELLLFEWKSRSAIAVALASAKAYVTRSCLITTTYGGDRTHTDAVSALVLQEITAAVPSVGLSSSWEEYAEQCLTDWILQGG
jgi:H+/Cl- antiporter ClcA